MVKVGAHFKAEVLLPLPVPKRAQRRFHDVLIPNWMGMVILNASTGGKLEYRNPRCLRKYMETTIVGGR